MNNYIISIVLFFLSILSGLGLVYVSNSLVYNDKKTEQDCNIEKIADIITNYKEGSICPVWNKNTCYKGKIHKESDGTLDCQKKTNILGLLLIILTVILLILSIVFLIKKN